MYDNPDFETEYPTCQSLTISFWTCGDYKRTDFNSDFEKSPGDFEGNRAFLSISSGAVHGTANNTCYACFEVSIKGDLKSKD